MTKDQLIQWIVSQYDALLTDNDGTCFRTEEAHAEIGAAILKVSGVPDMTYEERFGLMGYGEHGIWDHLAAQGRTPTISKDEFKKRQGDLFLQALPTIPQEKLWRPGMRELITAFHEAAKPVIVVSNTARYVVEALHDAGGERHRITDIIALEDILAANKQRKPEPDAYLMGAEKAKQLTGKIAPRMLALEDTELGLHAACAAAQLEDIDTVQIYYASVGHEAGVMADFTVADTLDICEAFREAVCGQVIRVHDAPAPPEQPQPPAP